MSNDIVRNGDIIKCHKCGGDVTVNVKMRYRMHPLAHYKCLQCGNEESWTVPIQWVIKRGE